MSEKPVRRSRSRHAGSITSYATQGGHRWRFQIYVPKDPERPELGDTRLTRGGFKSLDEAQRVLAEALAKKKSNARFQAKAPTIGEYAERWIAGLRLQNSTIQGYQKIIRNHVTPYLGAIQLDKLTATRIAAHYRQLETSGRRDGPGYGKPLSANTVSKVHVLLAAMLDAAVDDGLILLNPAKKKRTVNPPASVKCVHRSQRSSPGPVRSSTNSWPGITTSSMTSSTRCGAPSPTPACVAPRRLRCAGAI